MVAYLNYTRIRASLDYIMQTFTFTTRAEKDKSQKWTQHVD
jgi:hypothetical protein